jgi:hypothetical protein
LASVQTFAIGITPLKANDKTLSQARVELVEVKPVCGANNESDVRCLAFGAHVTLKVKLNGCADRLGGYFSNFNEVDGKGVLSVGAINISTKASESIRCYQQAFEMISIYIPFEGEVELKELSFMGQIIPMH